MKKIYIAELVFFLACLLAGLLLSPYNGVIVATAIVGGMLTGLFPSATDNRPGVRGNVFLFLVWMLPGIAFGICFGVLLAQKLVLR